MALTVKYMESIGLNEEQIEGVIEKHKETIEGYKRDIEAFKADSEKLKTVQRELDELKALNDADYKGKYEAEKAAHDKTKADYAAKETAAKVKDAYRALLKEAGVADKYIATALKATDFSGMKLDKDGKLEGADTLTESAKTEWADFIPSTTTQGAKVDTPPSNNAGAQDLGKMSMQEYIEARKKK